MPFFGLGRSWFLAVFGRLFAFLRPDDVTACEVMGLDGVTACGVMGLDDVTACDVMGECEWTECEAGWRFFLWFQWRIDT